MSWFQIQHFDWLRILKICFLWNSKQVTIERGLHWELALCVHHEVFVSKLFHVVRVYPYLV